MCGEEVAGIAEHRSTSMQVVAELPARRVVVQMIALTNAKKRRTHQWGRCCYWKAGNSIKADGRCCQLPGFEWHHVGCSWLKTKKSRWELGWVVVLLLPSNMFEAAPREDGRAFKSSTPNNAMPKFPVCG